MEPSRSDSERAQQIRAAYEIPPPRPLTQEEVVSQSYDPPERATLYVCENCGEARPIADFSDDCTPGWTHGRLIKITNEVMPVNEHEELLKAAHAVLDSAPVSIEHALDALREVLNAQ
jgi:hypothetical protein